MDDCYILGSGSSLLDLKADEVAGINRAPYILAFNKYLLFHHKIGIVPTHYLLGDYSTRNHLTLARTVRICRECGYDGIRFFLNQRLRMRPVCLVRSFLRPLRVWVTSVDPSFEEFKRVPALMIRDLGFAAQATQAVRSLRRAGRVTFTRRTKELKGGAWAQSLEEEIFHYRGTLTEAINLTTVLNPGARIKLLGVDLSDGAYFFADEIRADPANWPTFAPYEGEGTGKHTTATFLNGVPGILERISFVLEQVRAQGGDLVCCNPNSLLVTQNLLQSEEPI